MLELLFFLTIVTIALITVRVGTIALTKTGLSLEAASFQAQSAFMGVGFTTAEAETVVSHVVRRRIIQVLMLLGFGSITSALGTVVVAFAQPPPPDALPLAHRLALLVGGLFALVILWRLHPIERLLDRVITYALANMTELKIMDYESVLKLDKGYTIAHVQVEEGCWLAGKTLNEMQLSREGVLILSIQRETGLTLATPSSSAELHVGDKLLCYGLEDVLTNLSTRRCDAEGDRIHELNKRRQRLRTAEERVEDEAETAVESA